MTFGMKKFKPLLLSLLASMLLPTQVMAQNTIQFRLSPSVSGCTLDRSYDKPELVSSNTAQGEFSVQCHRDALPYRLGTTLSPLAKFSRDGELDYNVRWFFRHDGPACNGEDIHEDATLLHSGSRDVNLQGDHTKRQWSYCVQVQSGDSPAALDEWPLQGELSLSVVNANEEWVLPENASRIIVRFENNSSNLSESMQGLLDTLLMNMGDPNAYTVQLHAHTSLVGDPQYNHELSIMRLMRVRNYLVNEYKIPKTQTWGQAWGESRPAALNTIENEASQNRRVDVILLSINESDVLSDVLSEVKEKSVIVQRAEKISLAK
jgi:outer membrane protein OmpA-like peptidoglycan-associated protein